MNIILVSDSLAKSRSISLSQTQVVMIALGILLSGFVLAMATYMATMKFAVDLRYYDGDYAWQSYYGDPDANHYVLSVSYGLR